MRKNVSSSWFLLNGHKDLCVEKTLFQPVPTNIFWVFFTLLFNPTHPRRGPPTRYKFCQNSCNLNLLKLTRFGLKLSFLFYWFPTTTLTQGVFFWSWVKVFESRTSARAWKTFLFYATKDLKFLLLKKDFKFLLLKKDLKFLQKRYIEQEFLLKRYIEHRAGANNHHHTTPHITYYNF